MTRQMLFRALEHPKSSFFSGKRFNPKGIAGAFKARDYECEALRIMGSSISFDERARVSEAAERAFLTAQTRYRLNCTPGMPQISEKEREHFISYYPLSMIRDGVVSQLEEGLAKQIPAIVENEILISKYNLTGLFAMMSMAKPMSVVLSSKEVDTLSDPREISFGRLGSAIFHPLDKTAWLASFSWELIKTVNPEIFYTNKKMGGALLGYPEKAVEWFSSDLGDKYTLMEMLLKFDKTIEPWLFKGVFVPYVCEASGDILEGDVLMKWHESLARAVGPDLLELLNLEAKIETLKTIAEVAVKNGIAS